MRWRGGEQRPTKRAGGMALSRERDDIVGRKQINPWCQLMLSGAMVSRVIQVCERRDQGKYRLNPVQLRASSTPSEPTD